MQIAVVGAGLIGRRHIAHVAAEATLSAVVDPAPESKALALEHGAAWFPSLEALLARQRPDGAVIATPNRLHVEAGLACIDRGVPALIVKPIADDPADAERLVAAADRAGVPILVGHHRRFNPIVGAARLAIDEGRLGTIVAVQGSCWFHKPDSYFAVPWRREPGAGPVLINLVHDIDTLRYLCGDIDSVQAIQSNAVRGHAVEDSAVVVIRFRAGALGTLAVSDAVSAPWSWELTSGENPAYPRAEGQSCYHIGGTLASLSLPDLGIWSHAGPPDWHVPIERRQVAAERADPLVLQLRHFLRVIRGAEPPVTSARDGLETLRVVAAVKEAADRGCAVRIGEAA